MSGDACSCTYILDGKMVETRKEHCLPHTKQAIQPCLCIPACHSQTYMLRRQEYLNSKDPAEQAGNGWRAARPQNLGADAVANICLCISCTVRHVEQSTYFQLILCKLKLQCYLQVHQFQQAAAKHMGNSIRPTRGPNCWKSAC